MFRSLDVQLWTARLCMVVALALCAAGYYFENIRFVPPAAGFAILAVLGYATRRPPQPSASLAAPWKRDSGQRPTL